MTSLDYAMLDEMGFSELSEKDKVELLALLYAELEERVGEAIAALMTDQQMSEFGVFVDAEDEKGALTWLEDHCPQYPTLVEEQLAGIRTEMRSRADAILESANTAE